MGPRLTLPGKAELIPAASLRRFCSPRGWRAAYEGNDAKIAGVLDVGVVPADPALDRTALAALTNVAALVMSSPDAYTVR